MRGFQERFYAIDGLTAFKRRALAVTRQKNQATCSSISPHTHCFLVQVNFTCEYLEGQDEVSSEASAFK